MEISICRLNRKFYFNKEQKIHLCIKILLQILNCIFEKNLEGTNLNVGEKLDGIERERIN
jgi:hypothetical protein